MTGRPPTTHDRDGFNPIDKPGIATIYIKFILYFTNKKYYSLAYISFLLLYIGFQDKFVTITTTMSDQIHAVISWIHSVFGRDRIPHVDLTRHLSSFYKSNRILLLLILARQRAY